MSHSNRSNIATFTSSEAIQSTRARSLEAAIHLACEGDTEAADQVARELRERMVAEARDNLGIFVMEAEDVVDDLFVEMLECHVHPPRGHGRAVPMLLRIVADLARRRMLERAADWDAEDDGGRHLADADDD
jgi:hypothetical protein